METWKNECKKERKKKVVKKVEIKNTTKIKTPALPLDALKSDILGNDYNLSVVFVGEKRARNINKKWRNKSYTPNTLSFPLSKTDGEIIICLNVSIQEAKERKISIKKYIGFLVIHSMLHLKGYSHNSKMEKMENELSHLFFGFYPYE